MPLLSSKGSVYVLRIWAGLWHRSNVMWFPWLGHIKPFSFPLISWNPRFLMIPSEILPLGTSPHAMRSPNHMHRPHGSVSDLQSRLNLSLLSSLTRGEKIEWKCPQIVPASSLQPFKSSQALRSRDKTFLLWYAEFSDDPHGTAFPLFTHPV